MARRKTTLKVRKGPMSSKSPNWSSGRSQRTLGGGVVKYSQRSNPVPAAGNPDAGAYDVATYDNAQYG